MSAIGVGTTLSRGGRRPPSRVGGSVPRHAADGQHAAGRTRRFRPSIGGSSAGRTGVFRGRGSSCQVGSRRARAGRVEESSMQECGDVHECRDPCNAFITCRVVGLVAGPRRRFATCYGSWGRGTCVGGRNTHAGRVAST